MARALPKEVEVKWSKHYRIIPSKYPPITFFEKLVDPDLMEEVFYLESLTNDRLRDEVGDISLVRKEDRISGPGSSYVMAAFTHPALSRFSSGEFGIYYASKDLITAVKETVYHTERFLGYTQEPAGIHTRRVLQGNRLLQMLKDIRDPSFKNLHHPTRLMEPQSFGMDIKEQAAWGLLYPSVRDPGGENIAIFRPNALELPIIQTKHLEYHWNGERITHYRQLGEPVLLEE